MVSRRRVRFACVRPCPQSGFWNESISTVGVTMSLKEKINSEMVVAAKAKDSLKLGQFG